LPFPHVSGCAGGGRVVMSSATAVRRVRARRGAPGPRGGGVFVPVLQRARLLDATVGLVVEVGVRGLTVRRVTARAGMSSKTFYDLFSDREECLLAAFDHAVERIAGVVAPAYEGESGWVESVRGGLGALLGLLDRESVLARFVFVEALACGPLVLERRARLLEDLAGLIEAHAGQEAGGMPTSPLMAEGVIGAVCGVIHARLLEEDRAPLVGLVGGLMAMIVLPYRGADAAAEQLQISQADSRPRPADRPRVNARAARTSVIGRFRPTVRTFAVLSSVGEHPGLNNREISRLAGVSDQGQISRLLWRLEEQGLLENTGGYAQGTPKAWSLTVLGAQALQASPFHDAPSESA
jgi:AcrR family transcriptional regulator